MELLQFATSTLALLAFIAAGISLYVSLRTGSLHDLKSHVRALDNDLTDLQDRVEHWRGRDAVRKMRAGQRPEEVVPPTPLDKKAELRARLRARQTNGGAA